MPNKPQPAVLFLQHRASKAGAQVSLSRLLEHESVQKLRPVILTNSEGWLTSHCRQMHTPFGIMDFPSSRSWPARLLGNRMFANEVEAFLKKHLWTPALVVANDHTEALLAQVLAKKFKIPSAVILRSSGMTRRDYFKYHCHRFEQVHAVGSELQSRVNEWNDGKTLLFSEGLYRHEFAPPKPKPASFPTKLLCAGTNHPAKGWEDLVNAIDELETDPEFPALKIFFTDAFPSSEKMPFVEKSRRASFSFLGRREKFRETAREFDLAVHPSRHESFGLAPLEILSAGVPLLCSQTGMVEQVIQEEAWLFEPGNAKELAVKLKQLWQNWPKINLHTSEAQERLKRLFPAEKMAEDFSTNLGLLMEQKSSP